MKRQIIFKLTDTESFSGLTKYYFTKTGFKTISETENHISFAKGSTLLNMVTFNPLNWKSEVGVTLINENVVAIFEINTVGQLVTLKEEKLWDTFIENYKTSVIHKMDMTVENISKIKETKRDGWRYVKLSLVGAVVFGIPFSFLAYYSGLGILAPMGASIGAISFLTKMINDDRKKTHYNKAHNQ